MGIQQLSDAFLCCTVKVHSSLHEWRVWQLLTVQCVFGDVNMDDGGYNVEDGDDNNGDNGGVSGGGGGEGDDEDKDVRLAS